MRGDMGADVACPCHGALVGNKGMNESPVQSERGSANRVTLFTSLREIQTNPVTSRQERPGEGARGDSGCGDRV